MITFSFDDFSRMADKLDQAPERVAAALAEDLNTSNMLARSALVQQDVFWWPQSKNSGFLRGILRMGDFASADNLQVEIYPTKMGEKLFVHEQGGQLKAPSGSLAIPITNAVHKTAHGVVADQKPRAAGMIRIGDRIYKRVKRGKKSFLKLQYVLKPSATQPKDTDFQGVYESTMRDSMRVSFASSMIKAIMRGA
jgi:hypothetical protein